MEHRKDVRMHYKKCSYMNCNVNSRDNVASYSFHCFPVNDNERCITWLVNCGLDEWVELTNVELKKKCICSRHFPPKYFYTSGRLRKDAIPYLYPTDNNNDAAQSHPKDSANPFIKEQNRIKNLEAALMRERKKCNMLHSQLRLKCKALNRIKHKLSLGDITDDCLKKAIVRRVSAS